MAGVFYAMCFKEAGVANLRKFTLNWKTGPYFSVPQQFWTSENHPLLKTDMDKVQEDLVDGQRRSIRIKMFDKDNNRTRLAKVYMNASNQFVIGSELLRVERPSGNELQLGTHKEAEGKNLSAIELLNVFESVDSDQEDESSGGGIDDYIQKAKDTSKKRPMLGKANEVLNGSKKQRDEETKLEENDKACMSVYSDLNDLKKIFGRFEISKGCRIQDRLVKDGVEWLELVESYLVKKYGKADGIITHFYSFIDKKMFDWYFSLDFEAISTFGDFKSEFLKEVKKLEYEQRSLVSLPKSEFLFKFKQLGDSEKLKKLADDYPLTTYFVEKMKLIRSVYPNSFPDERELTEFVLSQIGSQQDCEKFMRFKNDLETLLYYLKHEDMSRSKPSI